MYFYCVHTRNIDTIYNNRCMHIPLRVRLRATLIILHSLHVSIRGSDVRMLSEICVLYLRVVRG